MRPNLLQQQQRATPHKAVPKSLQQHTTPPAAKAASQVRHQAANDKTTSKNKQRLFCSESNISNKELSPEVISIGLLMQAGALLASYNIDVGIPARDNALQVNAVTMA